MNMQPKISKLLPTKTFVETQKKNKKFWSNPDQINKSKNEHNLVTFYLIACSLYLFYGKHAYLFTKITVLTVMKITFVLFLFKLYYYYYHDILINITKKIIHMKLLRQIKTKTNFIILIKISCCVCLELSFVSYDEKKYFQV